MIQINHSVQIARPREQVFEYLANVDNLPKWQGNVLQARPIDSGQLRVGFQFAETLQMGSKQVRAIATVTDIKPNERVVFTMVSDGPLDCDAHFDLQPVMGGTRLTFSGKARLKGFMRLLQPFLARELRGETKKELETMKRLLETEVPLQVR